MSLALIGGVAAGDIVEAIAEATEVDTKAFRLTEHEAGKF